MGLFDTAISTSTVTSYPKYSDAQTNVLNKLLNQAYGGITTGAEKYSGDMYAKENPYETTFLNWDSPTAKTIQSALDTVLSGKAAYDITGDTTQAYWDKYMAPMVAKQQRALNEQYAPGIFSGGRDIAQGEFNTGVLGEYGKLQYADETARREALTDAMNRMANTVNTAYANEATRLKDTGELARSIQEKKIAGDYQRWMSGEADANGVVNQSANPYRSLALSLLGTSPYVYGSNVSSDGTGLGTSLLTGLGSGAGSVLASLLSSGGSGLLSSGGSGLWSLGSSALSSLGNLGADANSILQTLLDNVSGEDYDFWSFAGDEW